MPRLIGILILLVLGTALMTATVWNNPLDRRIVELTNRHTEQQISQNERLAKLQQQWQSERAELYQQRDQLEDDRKNLDAQRQREPVVAQSILQVGTLALALLPLAVCALLLRRPPAADDGDAIAETLVDDLLSPHPTLFVRELPEKSGGRLDARSPESSPKLEPPTP